METAMGSRIRSRRTKNIHQDSESRHPERNEVKRNEVEGSPQYFFKLLHTPSTNGGQVANKIHGTIPKIFVPNCSL